MVFWHLKQTEIEQMAYEPADQTDITLTTLARLCQRGAWQLSLAHDRGYHLLIWITRGQGVALLDGATRGVGTHNVLFVPARHLMALSLGRQALGQALLIPADTSLTLPGTPQHLRIPGVEAQGEMRVLSAALAREQNARQPLFESAMLAYCELVAIWLRRQMEGQPGVAGQSPRPESGARRLSRQWCTHLVASFTSSVGMNDHAAALAVSPTHLARVCRSQTGKTAAQLLAERQLHAAHQLLLDTDVPVQDIARHLGFANATGFTRFFKTHTGQPPTALRRAGKSQI